MKWQLYLLAAIGALWLGLLYWFTGLIIEFPTEHGSPLWELLANFLVALVLGYYILNSGSTILRQSIVVFLIYFIIGHFNLLIEAYIFNITDRTETSLELLRGFLVVLVFSPTYVLLWKLSGNISESTPQNFIPRSAVSWLWRILLGNFLYLFLYIGAGLILSVARPDIMEFYEGKIPPVDLMIETQVYLRAFLFIGVAILILRTMRAKRRTKAIYIGLVFMILGAIAPLLPSSDLMPEYVRWGHGIEVSISNFIYGFLLGVLYYQPNKVIAS